MWERFFLPSPLFFSFSLSLPVEWAQWELLHRAFGMDARVALSAERDQVLFLVAARLAAEFEMVDLEVLHAL